MTAPSRLRHQPSRRRRLSPAPPPPAASADDPLKAFARSIRTAEWRSFGGPPDAVAGVRRFTVSREPPQVRFAWPDVDSGFAPRPFDVTAIRRDFPALDQQVHGKRLVWFDNAATTQKPQCVIDAVANFYAHDNSNIHRGAHTLAARATDAYEQARRKVQEFLGASSAKEILFVRGTTEGINLVAQTYGRKFLQPGDEIVLTTLEHHANIVPWQLVAKEKGAVMRVVPGQRSGRGDA